MVHIVAPREYLKARQHLVPEVIHIGIEADFAIEYTSREQEMQADELARRWLGQSRPERKRVTRELNEDTVVTFPRVDLGRPLNSSIWFQGRIVIRQIGRDERLGASRRAAVVHLHEAGVPVRGETVVGIQKQRVRLILPALLELTPSPVGTLAQVKRYLDHLEVWQGHDGG